MRDLRADFSAFGRCRGLVRCGAGASLRGLRKAAARATCRPHAEQIFALANQARAQAGVGRLQWDPALAAAALQHCQRMAAEGPIAHRYGGEADVSGRAAQAGAHFSVIEENVAVGPSADAIHEEWMQSPGHRANLLSPDVDHVGVAVVAARGVLYAVADYSRGRGATERGAGGGARGGADSRERRGDFARSQRGASGVRHAMRACRALRAGRMPRFIMRWQGADLTRLPQALVEKLASGKYRQAAVGSCPAQVAEGAFTAYRAWLCIDW